MENLSSVESVEREPIVFHQPKGKQKRNLIGILKENVNKAKIILGIAKPEIDKFNFRVYYRLHNVADENSMKIYSIYNGTGLFVPLVPGVELITDSVFVEACSDRVNPGSHLKKTVDVVEWDNLDMHNGWVLDSILISDSVDVLEEDPFFLTLEDESIEDIDCDNGRFVAYAKLRRIYPLEKVQDTKLELSKKA